MSRYLVKTPKWLKAYYPQLVWNKPRHLPRVYLTFDDGPTTEVTEWVLEQLKEYQAKATFFVIGKNVVEHPNIFDLLKSNGHSVGNHTFNHMNGWKNPKEAYFDNVKQCAEVVDSSLFRPPYGRIKKNQIKKLRQDYDIIMWDVLSGDFDTSITGEVSTSNVLNNVQNGSIIVFHDSQKAFPRLKLALPKVLEELNKRGYTFEKL